MKGFTAKTPEELREALSVPGSLTDYDVCT